MGTVEELLVEKIAQEYCRLGVAAWHEAEALSRENAFQRPSTSNIFRYQTRINRQLYQAVNQLERLQRLREGDSNVPLNLQVLGALPTIGENQP
jgi:hypothetical protein